VAEWVGRDTSSGQLDQADDRELELQKETEESQEKREEMIKQKLKVVKWGGRDTSSSSSGRSSSDSESEAGDSDDVETGPSTTQKATSPLSKDTLAQEDEEHQSCTICLIAFTEHQLVCESNNAACKHIFCQECISSWLMTNDFCPICRREYLAEEV